MTAPLLTTKFYIPPAKPNLVPRPRLIERLNAGLQAGRKLSLISAPAGFGKTTLVSAWIRTLDIGDWSKRDAEDKSPIPNTQSPIIAWLSLDEGDNAPARFLACLVAALQTITADVGKGAWSALRSPQPPPTEVVLTALINEVAALPKQIVLVLDDYHLIEECAVHEALAFLLKHLPPHMHLVIATREDPPLPLARLRARGQLTELRVTDLRFVFSEAAGFLNQVMGLNLAADDIAALKARTEGWIAGLQLAALALQGTLSMQGHRDTASFIESFTGSHHFVMDYLVEEVLQQQPESIQTFLLCTSILDRLCAPLCDAVLLDPAASGQQTLEYLQHANLFIVALDNERRWYRYHHLFVDLLRQRLPSAPSIAPIQGGVAALHRRASVWYEQNGLELEAFQHAAAANDVERAARLVQGGGMPLHLRGALAPVLNWLESLPTTVLDARPVLWLTYASVVLAAGQRTGVEDKLRAAEAALQGADDETLDMIGRIAAIRATLAVDQQPEIIIAQARRALEYLRPDNLATRTTVAWTLGTAYMVQGERAAANRAFTKAVSLCQASGNTFVDMLASTGLGQVQELENQLHLAAQTYQHVLQLAGEPPQPAACEAYLGLARIYYQWNDLETAARHGQQSVQLAQQIDSVDTFAACGVFLARLKLVQGDAPGASTLLAEAEQFARQHDFVYRLPDIAAARALILLQQGELARAAALAEEHELPISQARIHLAQGEPSAALALLAQWLPQVEHKGWQDERLKVIVLQALAHHMRGAQDGALQLLNEALALAEPGGFIRMFVDKGAPMAQLLSAAAAQGIRPDYTRKLLAVYEVEEQKNKDRSRLPSTPPAQPLIEPLSPRELEVLQLIAHGLSNREISERLFLALSTVKGHNRRIYGKLQVQRRTKAIARARELGLL